MAAMLETLRATGRVDRVSLTVNTTQAAAVGLYRRFGFEVVREVDAIMGDGNIYREYIMERSLM